MAWSSQGEKPHECDKHTRLCYHLQEGVLSDQSRKVNTESEYILLNVII